MTSFDCRSSQTSSLYHHLLVIRFAVTSAVCVRMRSELCIVSAVFCSRRENEHQAVLLMHYVLVGLFGRVQKSPSLVKCI